MFEENIYFKEEADNKIIYNFFYYCSTTGKPTHLFRTKCVSLDSV